MGHRTDSLNVGQGCLANPMFCRYRLLRHKLALAPERAKDARFLRWCAFVRAPASSVSDRPGVEAMLSAFVEGIFRSGG